MRMRSILPKTLYKGKKSLTVGELIMGPAWGPLRGSRVKIITIYFCITYASYAKLNELDIVKNLEMEPGRRKRR